ncbi:SAM-dependent methyltransferase [Pseudooceanicola sediminis]|uniref:SAM-dependent methyltransferase n=1 Tax=Pseudooceanicola sediminis TaxID=2211117 RepID=A0A399J4Q4_9RHOB|nr:SAM-dependent methyltransferase [Pseudooceanicola sediminis]KAA2315419.1 SAM-dependent methyltransferase [Puniceibacterium sp. HSS470]RII40375.1 SAM-dependent methyltransferase [Pseudooceanicola sediminis]|tara:strand:- start:71786 stop:72613 length:828 start_codon:yes stop_codon:yes gene_type:complete
MTHPILTDPVALQHRRARATADGLFLHALVAEDLQDRISFVNRTFKDPVLVTPFPAHWQNLAQRFAVPPRIVPASDVLDLAPGSADLVMHVFDMHWSNDLVGQLIQCRRALRPDGLFLGVLFGGNTLTELRICLAEAEVEITGGLSPRIAPMGEVRDLGGLLQRAGLALPVADSDAMKVTFSSPLKLLRDLRHMGEANALNDRLRKPTRRAIIMRAMELYVQRHADAQGRIPATFELITLTGWAPDDSQQKPLRPGSAMSSLAAALGTDENPLKS